MRGILLLVFAAVLYAQPIVHGTVTEGRPDAPVGGAEVTLIEFQTVDGFVTRVPVATAYTDAKGAFAFHPERFGNYYIEARKAGYAALLNGGPRAFGEDAAESSVELLEARPDVKIDLYLIQPGALRGRLEDDDGKPMPGVRLWIEMARSPQLALDLTTDADGVFEAPKLAPGDYLVRVGPALSSVTPQVLAEFKEEDIAKIDRDLEASYWPGGVPQREAAVPMRVAGGTSADMGTLRPRIASYRRVPVRLSGAECQNTMALSAPVRNQQQQTAPFAGYTTVPCDDEFLVTHLSPGPYWFALHSGKNWALAEVDVRDGDNSPVDLILMPEIDVSVKIVAAEGASIEGLKNGRIVLDPARPGLAGIKGGPIGPRPTVIAGVQWPTQLVVPQLPPPYYVSQMRYGGVPVTNGIIAPAAGAELDLVIDDKPASLSGTAGKVEDGSVAVLLRASGNSFAGHPLRGTVTAGRFTIDAIPPGDYRLAILPPRTPVPSAPPPESRPVSLKPGENRTGFDW